MSHALPLEKFYSIAHDMLDHNDSTYISSHTNNAKYANKCTHTHTSTIPLMCTDPRRMQLHRIRLQASPLLTSTGELHPHPTHLRSINNFLNTFSFGKYCNTMNASMTSVISIVTGFVREPTTLRSAGPQVLNVLVWRSESSKCLTS